MIRPPALTGTEDCSIKTQSPTQEGKSYHHEIAHHHVADEESATGEVQGGGC
jgi:hypothetical protein